MQSFLLPLRSEIRQPRRQVGVVPVPQTTAQGRVLDRILDNDSLIFLLKSGAGRDEVLRIIHTWTPAWDLSPDEIIKLRQAGADDVVLAALVSRMDNP